jgi:hypothetical protein
MRKRPVLLLAAAVVGLGLAARSAAAPSRAVVRVHIDAIGERGATLRVFTTGDAAVGAGAEAPRRGPGTLRVATPATLTVDLTGGEVYVVGPGDRDIRLRATVDGAPAVRLTGWGRALVLERGGTGVRTLR